MVRFTNSLQQSDDRVNQFRLTHERLGEGAFGTVEVCEVDTPAGVKRLALKQLSRAQLSRRKDYITKLGADGIPCGMTSVSVLDRVYQEVQCMADVDHANVIKLYEFIDDVQQDELFMVMELAPFGELMSWDPIKLRYECRALPQNVLGPAATLPEWLARESIRQACSGLQHLHQRHVAHRDLKPDHLLVLRPLSSDPDCDPNVPFRVSLCDFGCAQKFESLECADVVDTPGTQQFFAPESCAGEAYNAFAADVWSLGVVLYILVFGQCPFFSRNMVALFDKIEKEEVSFPRQVSHSLQDLLRAVLTKSADDRLTLAQFLDHPWMRGSSTHQELGVLRETLQESHTQP